METQGPQNQGIAKVGSAQLAGSLQATEARPPSYLEKQIQRVSSFRQSLLEIDGTIMGCKERLMGMNPPSPTPESPEAPSTLTDRLDWELAGLGEAIDRVREQFQPFLSL